MTISGPEQLSPCPTGERVATVERMVLTRSSGKQRQPYKTLCGRSYCLSSQGMITDGSPPRNAPLRLPQTTNASGACTPPTSLSRANRYSASHSEANITPIGRDPRMPVSHNQQTQSPIRWNCVQLKQHRQWLEDDGSWTLPTTSRAKYQMRMEPGVIRKNS